MTHQKGLNGERWAAWSLRLKGYRILAHRYSTPVGEIDLVAAKSELIVFVEVKLRESLEQALEVVSYRQRNRIKRAAMHFLQYHPHYETRACRFDLVALSPGRWPRHITAAWD